MIKAFIKTYLSDLYDEAGNPKQCERKNKNLAAYYQSTKIAMAIVYQLTPMAPPISLFYWLSNRRFYYQVIECCANIEHQAE